MTSLFHSNLHTIRVRTMILEIVREKSHKTTVIDSHALKILHFPSFKVAAEGKSTTQESITFKVKFKVAFIEFRKCETTIMENDSGLKIIMEVVRICRKGVCIAVI